MYGEIVKFLAEKLYLANNNIYNNHRRVHWMEIYRSRHIEGINQPRDQNRRNCTSSRLATLTNCHLNKDGDGIGCQFSWFAQSSTKSHCNNNRKKLEKLVIETKQTWSEADNVTTLKRIVALFVVEFLSFFDSRFLLAPHVIRNLCL